MGEIPRWARWAAVAVALAAFAAGCSNDGEQVPTVGTEAPGGASSSTTPTGGASSSTTSTSGASSGGGYGY